ncbi:hypothetical protein ACOSQ3_005334 [Xanthoceras sorbifolium]
MEVFSELVRLMGVMLLLQELVVLVWVAEIGSTPVVIRDMGVAVGEAILVEEVSKGTADVSLPGDSNTEDGTEIQVINSPRRKAWKRLARGVSSVRAQSSSGGSNLGKRSFVLADDDEEGQQLKRGKDKTIEETLL